MPCVADVNEYAEAETCWSNN